MIDPQIGNPVPHKHVLPAVGLPENEQDGTHGGQTEIRPYNQMFVLFLIHRTGRLKMVHAATPSIPLALAFTLDLLLMDVVARGIVREV